MYLTQSKVSIPLPPKELFTNYIDKIWGSFDPPVLTISMVWTLTKSGHFWTTYLPRLVNVDCERPPKLTSKQPYRVTWMTVCRFEGEGKGTGYTLLQQCDLWKLWGLGRTATITKFQNFDATSCYCKNGMKLFMNYHFQLHQIFLQFLDFISWIYQENFVYLKILSSFRISFTLLCTATPQARRQRDWVMQR